jgi:hypothetical protein
MSANVTATRWYYQVNSSGAKVEITAGTPYANHALTQVGTFPLLKSLDISANVVAANNSMRYTCEIDYLDPDTTLSIKMVGDFEIIKIATGVSSYVGYLTNGGAGVPCDMNNAALSFVGVATTFSVMKGAVVDSGWSISKTLSGVTLSDSADNAASVATSKTATVNGITADSATVTFTATKANYATITSVFNIWKVKAGMDSKVYEISSTSTGLTKSEAKILSPSSVTFSATSIQGTVRAAYAGRFKIYEALDATPNSYGTAVYSSATDELTKSYSPTTNVNSIKVELYAAGGFTTLLDVETVTVTRDGFDAAFLQVWIAEGNNVKNDVGTVKIKADMYKGGVAVTPTAFAWYYLSDLSVWTLLDATTPLGTTGYTSATLVVPASFIEGTENFKCVVTYNSIQYSNVTTVRVIDDPIVCELSGGNVIRNGANSLVLTAKVLREGVDIDPGGTLYAYEWNLLNPTTLAVVFDVVADTKTVTIAPADFVGMAVAQCVATEK